MTILITGATGKTARRIASQLSAQPSPPPLLLASRTGKEIDGRPGVAFDWDNPAAWPSVFAHDQAHRSPITAVYLVAKPQVLDLTATMIPFIDQARSQGVKRFVLLSGTSFTEADGFAGAIQKYLRELGEREGVEWAVLRASWFMGAYRLAYAPRGCGGAANEPENFTELQHFPTIVHQSAVYSAAQDGRIPFVSAEDIAAVGAVALTAAPPPQREYLVVGPDLLTYDEVAKIISECLGREIKHVRLSEHQLVTAMTQHGLPPDYAQMLAGLDQRIARGQEAIQNDVVESTTGRKPVAFRDFAQKNQARWAVPA